MKKIFLLFGVVSVLLSCDRIKEGTKNTINESGEKVGKSATEFFEGVSEGVEQTLRCEIEFSKELTDQGISFGNYSIENSTKGGSKNRLTAYVIFEKEFSDTIFVKAFNKENLEIGRVSEVIEGKSGEAKYVDFDFDKRTYIGVKSKISVN